MVVELKTVFNRAQVNDSQVSELIGLSRGMTADGAIN